MTDSSPDSTPDHLQVITEALQSGAMLRASTILNALHPAEIAHLLQSLPYSKRLFVWNMLDHDDDGEILLMVGDEVRDSLVENMDLPQLLAATDGLDVDDLADLLHELPDEVMDEALNSMDSRDRERLVSVLSFDEDCAGGLMNTDTVTVRMDVTVEVVLRYLRRRQQLPENTDRLFVVDRYEHYLGTLPLSEILTSDPSELVRDVMRDNVDPIPASTPESKVAQVFEQLDLVSAAVVDENGRLLGRITIDDVVDVIREEAEHSVLSMAGLNEDHDLFAPLLKATQRRAIWLGVNLLTAFLAAWVISQFQDTLEQLIVLAVLVPVVASMGGIAGSQTLTLVIRGLALGQIAKSNSKLVIARELGIGVLNGVIWAIVVAIIAIAWFGNAQIGLIIALAMIANLICAGLAGVIIPILLRKIDVDPALAGGVVLTTVTDVVGIFAFLGLATWWLV